MRKLILAIAFAFSVAGCATVQNLTATVTNPVTPQMLYDVENGLVVVFAGLNTYRTSCIRKLIPSSCRDVIATMQPYTRILPPMLVGVRGFVNNNDQVNAITAYNAIVGLVSNMKATAKANGIATGGA